MTTLRIRKRTIKLRPMRDTPEAPLDKDARILRIRKRVVRIRKRK